MLFKFVLTSMILMSLFGILTFIFLLYCIIDVISSSFQEPNNKLLWLIIIIALPLVGCILYMLIGKKQKVMD